MIESRVSLPELALVAGTRAVLGFGIGLLVADRFSDDERRGIGWCAFLVGAISTVPLALEVLRHRTSMNSPRKSRFSEVQKANEGAEEATQLAAASC